MDIVGRFWILKEGRNFLGDGRITLLRNIESTGSISQAAKLMGMSYKAAWDDVDVMNNLANTPLVIRNTGGKHGGGTSLTEAAHAIIQDYEYISVLFEEKLMDLQQIYDEFGTESMNLFPVEIRSKWAPGIIELRTGLDLELRAYIINYRYISHLSAYEAFEAYIPANRLVLGDAESVMGMDEHIKGAVSSYIEKSDFVIVTFTAESGDNLLIKINKNRFDKKKISNMRFAFYNMSDLLLIGGETN